MNPHNHTQPPRFADAYLSTGVRLRYAEQGDATVQEPAGEPAARGPSRA